MAFRSFNPKTEAVANFAFPGLNPETKELVGYYGREGVNVVRNQLKSSFDMLNKKVVKRILLKTKGANQMLLSGAKIYVGNDGGNVFGSAVDSVISVVTINSTLAASSLTL